MSSVASDWKQEFGRLLRARRQHLMMTQMELSAKVSNNSTDYTAGSIEQGTYITLTVDLFVRVCDAVQLDPVTVFAEVMRVRNHTDLLMELSGAESKLSKIREIVERA